MEKEDGSRFKEINEQDRVHLNKLKEELGREQKEVWDLSLLDAISWL